MRPLIISVDRHSNIEPVRIARRPSQSNGGPDNRLRGRAAAPPATEVPARRRMPEVPLASPIASYDVAFVVRNPPRSWSMPLRLAALTVPMAGFVLIA